LSALKDILVNVGAIAGVASIVGLAVLAMLYFSQARDVRRLREWAGREPERAAEVEQRAAQIASQAIAQAYESMSLRQSEADAAAQIAHEQGVEVADLVVAADPLAPLEEPLEEQVPEDAEDSEEHLEEHPEPVVSGMEGAVDDPEHLDELAAAAASNGDAPVSVDTPASVDTPVSVDTAEHLEPVVSGMEGAADDPEHLQAIAAESETAEERAESAVPPIAVPPIAVPAAAGATGEVRPSRLSPSTPAATRGQIPLPPLPPLDTSEFLAVNRPLPTVTPDFHNVAESTGAGEYETGGRPPERRSGRTPMIVAGILVALFAAVLLVTLLKGGNNNNVSTNATTQQHVRDQRTVSTSPHNPRINRPAVNVSVLNGTQTSGLAKLVGDQLIAAGFTSTKTGNRNDGTNHPTSTVFYISGSKLEAQEVAKELKIKNVKPIDSGTQAASGSAPVVVVLGNDIQQ
jgi:LytR cell envelope-related transcriptional attenuator